MPASRTASSVGATRGFPARVRMFLRGTPRLSPRAGTIASRLPNSGSIIAVSVSDRRRGTGRRLAVSRRDRSSASGAEQATSHPAPEPTPAAAARGSPGMLKPAQRLGVSRLQGQELLQPPVALAVAVERRSQVLKEADPVEPAVVMNADQVRELVRPLGLGKQG